MVAATLRGNTRDFDAWFVVRFSGVFIFHPAVRRSIVLDDLAFFDVFEFFDEFTVGNFFHLVGFLTKDIFLLKASHEITKEVVEDEGAGEVNHDKKHHDWHHVGHLAGHNLIKLSLVGFFAVSGFTHNLAESFGFLGFFRGELLTRNPELSKGRAESKEEHHERAD